MDLRCYLRHSPSFEPSDCAAFFAKNNLNVIIDSDYTDDTLEIVIRPAGEPYAQAKLHTPKATHKNADLTTEKRPKFKPYVFCSFKMDRALYREMLNKHPNHEQALHKHNAIAEIAPTSPSERVYAALLLAYLHNYHNAKVYNNSNGKFLGTKKLKELYEENLEELLNKERLTPVEFARKYHLTKVILSLALIIGYLIFDHFIYYSSSVFLFVVVISIIILWLT